MTSNLISGCFFFIPNVKSRLKMTVSVFHKSFMNSFFFKSCLINCSYNIAKIFFQILFVSMKANFLKTCN